ncbi:MAG: DUF433 domain-containing protein [Ktedonobacterales bacterium]|nr:DUF433 domain-containing protein [Ktedonobacterales bacterium]
MPVELADGIRSDPAILGGKPVIAGTRIPVEQVVGLYHSGATMEDFLEGYHLSEEQVQAALIFAQHAEQDAASHDSHA